MRLIFVINPRLIDKIKCIKLNLQKAQLPIYWQGRYANKMALVKLD